MNSHWKLLFIVVALLLADRSRHSAQAPAPPPSGGRSRRPAVPVMAGAPAPSRNLDAFQPADLQPMSSCLAHRSPKSPAAPARSPTMPARCGASTTSPPTRCASPAPIGPNKPSSIGFCAKPVTKPGTAIRSGMLSANGRTLRVYHTPQMQEACRKSSIASSTRRPKAKPSAFASITIGSPSWRAKMQHVLRPVPVQSQGVQAWVMSKEDAAMMMAELQKRTDFREHSSPHLLVQNGQSTIVTGHAAAQLHQRCDLESRKSGRAFSRKWRKSTKAFRWSSSRCCRSTANHRRRGEVQHRPGRKADVR